MATKVKKIAPIPRHTKSKIISCFFGKSGNVWNNIMIAFLGIMASRFFFYISKSAMAEKMVKSPFVYTEGAEMFSKAELFFKYFSFFIVVITVAIIILNMTTNDQNNGLKKVMFEKVQSKPNTLAVLSNIRINKSTVMTIPITLPLVMFIPQF